jgi:hypothetical protein
MTWSAAGTSCAANSRASEPETRQTGVGTHPSLRTDSESPHVAVRGRDCCASLFTVVSRNYRTRLEPRPSTGPSQRCCRRLGPRGWLGASTVWRLPGRSSGRRRRRRRAPPLRRPPARGRGIPRPPSRSSLPWSKARGPRRPRSTCVEGRQARGQGRQHPQDGQGRAAEEGEAGRGQGKHLHGGVKSLLPSRVRHTPGRPMSARLLSAHPSGNGHDEEVPGRPGHGRHCGGVSWDRKVVAGVRNTTRYPFELTMCVFQCPT